jgi:hypothetical protein
MLRSVHEYGKMVMLQKSHKFPAESEYVKLTF